MEARLIAVVLFVCSVCHFTEAQLPAPTALNTTITRTTCGSSKLCVSTPGNCDPSGNSSCFFSSTQLSSTVLTVEISGSTSGYVALGLIATTNLTQPLNQGVSAVFVCGNNNNSFFFQTATQNGAQLTPVNTSTINITSIQGSVMANQSLVQCTFNITFNSTFTQLPFNVTILNGTTNGTALGNLTTIFSSGPLDLANPKSNIPVLNITRDGCGSSKLCFSNASGCNPAGNSSCFFSSVQTKSQNFSFELSGTKAGYVALGLMKQNSTVVFICGNDTTGGNFFFQTAIKNGTSLTLTNVTTVYNNQGVVSKNQTLIQCIFNTTTTLNFSTKADDTKYQVTIMSGTTNGTQLGDPAVLYDSKTAIDLSDPTALNPSSSNAVSLCTNVLAVMLSALTLRLL
ncbi:putative ferric-chelate reductase 1 isoform X2 [Pangasianodon hypophthalmus]|uniref:putative ferric-chelate reductase 1 isoform X2 n=1 Tax=Pangasianodon hypophthalmus TaxID=310915 RepID=UPI002306EFD8|nr:putative ferric-chelate reductase 1 isoform X2 [Pangasianodon hypophthalmus]